MGGVYAYPGGGTPGRVRRRGRCGPARAGAGAGAGLCWAGLGCAGLVCAGLGLGTIVHTVYRIGYCIYGIRYPNSL